MGPRTGMECDGVNNCKEVCLLADKYNITYEDCYNDEDPTRCSICPKDYGYPKREGRDLATPIKGVVFGPPPVRVRR